MAEIVGGTLPAATAHVETTADGRKIRAILLLVFFGLFFFSLYKVSQAAPNFHVGFSEHWAALAIIPIWLTITIGVAFVLADFSFGYVTGFYLFVMMAGYFWLNRFSLLDYEHDQALIASAISVVAFLLPALMMRSDVFRMHMPNTLWDRLPEVILAASSLLLIWCALDGVRLVGFSQMDEYRAAIVRPRLVQYAIGNTTGALVPFAIACALVRGRKLLVAALCIVSLLYYPVTLTKTAVFAAPFILFIAALSARLEPRLTTILSLFIPLTVGLVVIIGVDGWPDPRMTIFGVINFRLLAIPSISLEHYFEFFHHHPHTYFCQISFLKSFVACPYSDQLGVVFANEYRLGNMNASLFATEGVASVGMAWMPITALACGAIIGLANIASAGLPARFILISGAMIPHTSMNVPLSTTLLTNGLALLMLLWWIAPRAETSRPAR